MEEQEFKRAYLSIRERPCPFEKSQLARHSRCRFAQQFRLADRGGISCKSDPLNPLCQQLLEQLRSNVHFLFKQPHGNRDPLPHAKEIKVQSGGLLGLKQLLSTEALEEQGTGLPIEDIASLIEAAINNYQALDTLPFNRLIPAIAAFETRRRPRKR